MTMLDPQEQEDIKTACIIALQAVRDRMFTIKNSNGVPFTEKDYDKIFVSWEKIIEKIDNNKKQ